MRRWGPMLHPYEIVRSERWSFGLFTSFTLNLGFFETVVYDAWRGRRSQELNVNPFTACTLRTGGQQDICADSEKPACQQGASWTSYLSPRRRRLFSSRRFSIFRRLVQDTAVFFPRGVAFFVAGDFSSPSSQFLDDSVGHWMPLAVAASF